VSASGAQSGKRSAQRGEGEQGPELAEGLAAAVGRGLRGATGVAELRRLSGGASQETWSFDATSAGARLPLVLRRRPAGTTDSAVGMALPLETEAELLRLAAGAAVPVPGVRFVLEPGDGLGSGYVMERLAGETIARRILRDEAFADVRPRLARHCGEILARIHSVPRASLPELPVADAEGQLARYRAAFDAFDHPHPVFELAFRWIGEHLPPQVELSLVHGDFRNGNLLVGADGVRGVLDWEIAHVGDPMEDLGWLCVNSWRFGAELPVGGFGTREELFAGYEAAGGRAVDPARVRFWEIAGTLRWGIICMMMYGAFARGSDASVERAAIGRRSSEAEIDLLELLL
jgi:aminoglycoside phosphotransferase (APT) family kinase protein